MFRFLENPENFLHSSNLETGQFEFIEVDRKTLSELPFLDNRYLGEGRARKPLPILGIFQNLGRSKTLPRKKTLNFIFHSSFCCSTMLASCLDIPGKNLSLKEPLAFLGLAQYQQSREKSGTIDPNWWAILNLSLFLLSRPFAKNDKTLIKPSNAANNLAAEVLESPVTGKMLLLYSPLERFLVSILSGGAERTETVNNLLADVLKDYPLPLPLNFHEISFLSPIKKAALLWGLQINLFSDLVGAEPDRVKTLDCEVFLENPDKTLVEVFKLFEIEVSKGDIKTILEGQAFKTNSKVKDAGFSKDDWQSRKNEVLKGAKKEIEEGLGFAQDLDFPIEGNLPGKLFNGNPL